MTTKKTDRRIERTRKLLLDAFVELVLEKGYKKLTVQDIIDRANVGRSTFYAHFQDKEALLEYGFSGFAHGFFQQAASEPEPPARDHVIHSLDFFRHAYENRALFLAIAESGGRDLILDISYRHMQHNILSHIGELTGKDNPASLPTPVVATYLSGSLQSLLLWWLENKSPYSPEEMDAMFNRLTMSGLREVLGLA